MALDPVLLSRVQFAFVISFHIIFPAFTIGLAAWLATLEGDAAVDRQRSSIGASSTSGSRCSPSRSAWAWSAGSSWPSSSAPTGAYWRNAPDRSRGRCSATRPSPPSCWKRRSSASCCSAATGCRPGSIFSPAAWSRSARCSRRSGSSPTTAGCRCRSATRSSTARSSPRIGGRSRPGRSCGCDGRTCCWRLS